MVTSWWYSAVLWHHGDVLTCCFHCRPLDCGVKVIAAHCATEVCVCMCLGEGWCVVWMVWIDACCVVYPCACMHTLYITMMYVFLRNVWYKLPYWYVLWIFVPTLHAGSCSGLWQWWSFRAMFRVVPEAHERGKVSSNLFGCSTNNSCVYILIISGTRIWCLVIFLPCVRSGGCHIW